MTFSKSFLAFSLLMPLSAVGSMQKCEGLVALLKSAHQHFTPKFIHHGALASWHLLRGGYGAFVSQYTFPFKVTKQLAKKMGLREGEDVWARPVELWKDGSKASIGYLLYAVIPAFYTQSIHSLHEDTDEDFFKGIEKKDLIVVIDGFELDGKLEEVQKDIINTIVENRKSSGQNVVLVSPESWRDLARLLNQLRTLGGPLKRLDYYGHGLPGGISFKHSLMDNSNLSSPRSQFFPHLSPDLMAPNAIVRLNTCLVGQNEDQFLENFGTKLLSRGGKIFASTRVTVPTGFDEAFTYLTKKELPDWTKDLQDKTIGGPIKALIIAGSMLEERRIKSPIFMPPTTVRTVEDPVQSK